MAGAVGSNPLQMLKQLQYYFDFHWPSLFSPEYLPYIFKAMLILVLFIVLERVITGIVVRRLLTFMEKEGLDSGYRFLQAFIRPLRYLILLAGAYAIIRYLPLAVGPEQALVKICRLLLVLIFIWWLYNISGSDSLISGELQEKLHVDSMLIPFFSKVVRFIIVALALVLVLKELGYDVNGFVAGLGIGGLAFALAAQDTIANIFGGIVILVEKPFTIGDWILSKDVEGMVEDITFRSTKVRTFAQALVTVPNSALAKQAITNWTRMGRRRISFTLGVAKNTSRQEMKQILDKIRDMLSTHPEVHPATIFANFDKFGEYSLDILIYCFTKTTAWGQWLQVKEDILFKIMAILEEEGVKLALPVRSIMKEESQQ